MHHVAKAVQAIAAFTDGVSPIFEQIAPDAAHIAPVSNLDVGTITSCGLITALIDSTANTGWITTALASTANKPIRVLLLKLSKRIPSTKSLPPYEYGYPNFLEYDIIILIYVKFPVLWIW
jgi:hypothetical protein